MSSSPPATSRREVVAVVVACLVAVILPVVSWVLVSHSGGFGDFRGSWADRWASDIAFEESVQVDPDALRVFAGRGAPDAVTVPGTELGTGRPQECYVWIEDQVARASCSPTP